MSHVQGCGATAPPARRHVRDDRRASANGSATRAVKDRPPGLRFAWRPRLRLVWHSCSKRLAIGGGGQPTPCSTGPTHVPGAPLPFDKDIVLTILDIAIGLRILTRIFHEDAPEYDTRARA